MFGLAGFDAAEEGVEVGAGVGPVERFLRWRLPVLESQDAFGKMVEVAKVAGLDRLAPPVVGEEPLSTTQNTRFAEA